jgi:5-phospho-D-xylono-1,4-lactonase
VPTTHGAALTRGERVRFDGHAHAWIAPPNGVDAAVALHLDDEAGQAAALAAFARAAAPRRAALLDCQPPGAGRDGRRLAALSAASGVAIACVTGFHQARYYPGARHPWRDAAEAQALFEHELTTGLTELAGRRAAALKAAHEGAVGADAVWWEAAVAARERTDALLLVHTERGAGVEGLIAWLADRGVPLGRVYLCHVDKRPDAGLHRELARAGVLLGYDTFLRPAYGPDTGVWPLLRGLLADGLGHAVVIGLDLAVAAMWRGGAGPVALVDDVEARLRAEGVTEAECDALLGGTVLRALPRTPTVVREKEARP